MSEEFRQYNELYEISNLGNVRRLGTQKILATHQDSKKKGYCYITLNMHGKKVTKQVHRMVAEVFIPNPYNFKCINHKDENPSNNVVTNLEWCTYSYNLKYGTKISRELTTKTFKKTRNAPKTVIQKTKEGTIVHTYSSAQEAAIKNNLFNCHILDCCQHKVVTSKKGTYTCRSYGGYLWEFGTTGSK